MAHETVRQGTGEELAKYLLQHRESRFRLIELVEEDEQPARAPNTELLTMLQEIAKMKAGMKPTDGDESDRLLEEARAGAMYDESCAT